MIQQGILEKSIHSGSDWATPIVAIKKTNGDIRICDDYKIDINHQTCSDSFPLLSIKTASHELANMKHFVKTDLKSAYNQIEIDDKFKEITTLNTLMGLWRWSCLPFASYSFQRENLIRKSGQHHNLSRRYMSGSPHQRGIKE